MGLFEPNEGALRLVLFGNYFIRITETSQVTPIDDNNKSVEIVLWEAGAVEYDEQTLQNDTIVTIKARVLDLNGQLLNCPGNIIILPFNAKRAIQVNNTQQSVFGKI